MKFNIEIDVSPEELREFFGLPDVGGLQQQWLGRMSKDFSDNADVQRDVFEKLVAGAVAPWSQFFGVGRAADGSEKKDD